MPIYDFFCRNCERRIRIRLTYDEYDQGVALCPHCGRGELKRLVGRIAITRSEGSRLDNLMNSDLLDGLENDPRSMGRFMREMSREMGEEMGDDLSEVATRLEKGESLESIERSMPDLDSSTDFGSDDM